MSTLAYIGIGWAVLCVLFVWGNKRWYDHLARISPHDDDR